MTTNHHFSSWQREAILRMLPLRTALCLLLFSIGSLGLSAQACTLQRGPGETVSEDYDLNQGPYTTDVDVYATGLNASFSVNSNVTFTICFWGDMNGNNETFDVTIGGSTFNSGNFGGTDAGNPACRDFTVSAANVKTDLSDGDIDISYGNFGGGWTIPPVTDPPNPNPSGDNFNARVEPFVIDFQIDPIITNPSGAFVCQNEAAFNFTGAPANGTAGGVGNFSIAPASAALNTTTGAFDPAAAEPGTYQVTYRFTYEGCAFTQSTSFEVVPLPVATLEDAVAGCSTTGFSLTDLFTDATLEGGTFSSSDADVTIMGTNLSYSGVGCVDVTYTLENPGGCTGAITTGTASIFFPEAVRPEFLITSSTSCWDGTAPLAVEIDYFNPDYTVQPTYEWTEFSSGVNVIIGDATSATNPMISLEQEGGSTSGTVQLCLSETITSSGPCSGDEECTDLKCRSFTVTIAPCNEECGLFSAPPAICPILTNPSFAFEILGQVFAFGSPGAELFEASVTPSGAPGSEDAIISCTEPGIEVSWAYGINEDVFPSNVFDVPLSTLVPPVAAYCRVAAFGFNFPTGFCGDCGPKPSPNFCVDILVVEPCILIERVEPLAFLNFDVGGLGPICDITGRELIVEPLQTLVQETAVAVVWADTDGDGAFDYVLEQGGLVLDGSGSGTAFVPNNIQGEGTITVRNLTASVLPPYSPCVAPEGKGLLDFLPIGAIPIVGPIIEEVFMTLGIDINIAPSANFDLPIRVVNDQDPTFLNLPSQYVFSQFGDCSTPINFSNPIAVDACTGDIIEDVVQISGPASGDILQIPNPDSIGTDNPNTYEVTYRATSCNGSILEQTFKILISSNDPLLKCSEDIVIKNDVDACSKVVTGLSPLQGAGCNNTITWTAPGATPSSGNDDASGTVFPVGTTTVTYTLTYADENGATQTQTCNFDVTVEDAQAPTALCRDFEVQIADDGQAIVTVADINGGSYDNCPGDLLIDLARTDMVFGPDVTFGCFDEGQQTVILRVTDAAANERRCLALVTVTDYFSDYELALDVPELCIEANNPEQLDFSNYLVITDGEGNTTSPLDEMNDGDMVGGMFSISGFNSSVDGADIIVGTSVDEPGTVGYINPITGQYTPGTGTGFVEITYIIVIDGGVRATATGIEGCYKMVTDIFELRQPLTMDEPECECIVQNDRVVNLGEISGGLEPYTIQYGGVKFDFDGDGISDEQDGEFTFEGAITGTSGTELIVDITDFTQDLGNLLVDYTQPTWFFTVVDARGCELFRSGSCDNDDENGTPEILCEDLGPVALFTEELVCEANHTWDHTLPTDNCDVILYTYTITNPDGSTAGPFDLTALLNPDITNPLPDQFSGSYNFQHVSPTQNTSTVTYYAEDAVGNFTQCSFEVTVTDDDPPRFINCPEPAVIVDAPATWCSAFANYSLPLAEDNCSIPVVTQVDDTGLTSGDLYPVGITINTFEAVDPTGNRVRCDVKIIVNDFHTPPTFECPGDVAQDTDTGDCGAVVNDIAPTNIADNCLPNLTIVYRIDDADGNEVASGFDDASGNFFGLGENTVSYSVQDMPLLLITEITHDLNNAVDGTVPVPDFTDGNPADGDYLEITNFNRAALDVSCLMVKRTHAGGVDEYAVPTFTILQPGGTLTIHFGDGVNSPADDYFNVPGAANLAANEPAAYSINLSRSVLDVAVMNGYDLTGLDEAAYWAGTTGPVSGAGIIRTTVWDTNTAADFAPGEACLPTTIGTLNPGLAQPTPNGASTAIQAQPTTRVECDFNVTITDREAAVCGLYGEWNDYGSDAIDVEYGQCIETVYTVGEAYTVSDVNLNIAGMAGDMGNLTFTLISPEGTEVELAAAVCAGTNEVEFTFDGDFGPGIEAGCGILNNAGDLVMPVGDIEIFNGEAAAGDWILQIGHNGQESLTPAAFTSSILFISSREAYPDYTTTLENDLGVCGADYTWNHAILFDNCPGGTILWTIVDSSGTTLESQALPIFPENVEVTFFFPVGISTVTYALTDGNGNTSSCSFDVTVNDTEDPVIVQCPADVVIQLEGGDCEEAYTPTDYEVTDNCAVVDIFGTPAFNELLPIGVNEIVFTAVDAAGNDATCTYTVTILEYIPENPQMACINQINIHLQADCEQEIIPAMVLAGREYYCFDNYELTLFQRNEAGTFDTLEPSVVGIDQIGAEIRYEVYDPRNDESCWGNIDVGFFEPPAFICPPNATVSCNASTDTSLMGVPVLQSCALAGATVAFADTLQRNDACDDPRAILRRTWLVTDAYGNEASCVQTITIEAFDLSAVRFPANLDGVDAPAVYCADAAADATLTDPENTGFPFVDDGSDIFTTNFCSASYLYSDEVFNICAGSYEILRTWKVRNTCQPVVPGVNPIEAVQIIRVLDFENPALTCPDDVTVSTSGIDCNGAYLIPEPVVETGCTNWDYTVSASAGDLSQLPDGTYLLSGLDEGVFTIRYEVEDECGRYSECIFNLTVVDQVGPTASCEDGLNVSLDGNGQAIISAADVDGNSADLCGDVELEIRRLYELDPESCAPTAPFYTAWSESIGVNCCDLEDLVTVELRVTDEDGNSSVCWTEILVEDKIAPTCIAPGDVTITCVDYQNSLPNDIADASEEQLNALFGFAGAADNCSVTITQTVAGSINNCGVGQLVRTFTATDGGGLTNNQSCTQTIDIVAVFDYQVTLPMDVSGTCAEIPGYDDLAFNDFGCDLLTVTTNVDTLRTLEAGDECFKLRVTYDAVNWCEYNSLGEPYLLPRDGHNGRDPEAELLYLNVTAGADINIASDDDAFLSRFSDRVFNGGGPQNDRRVDDGSDIDGTNDDNGEIDARAYAQDDSRGAFRYVQYIKVYDEVAPVITAADAEDCFSGNGDNCTAEVTLSFTAVDECSDVQVTAQLDVDYDETFGFLSTRALTSDELSISVTGEYIINLSAAPVGEHAIRINAADGCGNFDNAIIEFCVEPELAPTPICIQTLTVTLTDDGDGGGIAAIWASDFIASPITDCFGNEIDTYSLYADEVASGAGFLLEENQLGVTLTCAELEASGSEGYPVRLYAFDAVGNNDYCTVFVEIQQNASTPCDDDGSTGALAGIIVDEQMNAIEGVTVSLEGSGDISNSLVTTTEGTFSFTNLPIGGDYTISPAHYEDYLNGVRTSDIVAITRHILSTELLAGPYSMLAADVDGNTSIDVGDIISIRRLILGQIESFPANMPSWMFVPADFTFPNSGNPWAAAFPTVSNHNDLAGNILDVDFIGVKLGDINQSAQPNEFVSGAPRSINGTLDLQVAEVAMHQGETYRVPVFAKALTEVDGYQFTLEFDRTALEVTNIEPGLVAAGNFGWNFADRGLITTSWNWTGSTIPTDWTGEEVLFTMIVRATADENLSEGIDITSRYTAAEAYERNTGNLRNLALVFNEVTDDNDTNELFQNIPNPVRNQTVIGFQLATAQAEVVISIRDAAGRVVREIKQEGTAGYNSFVLDNRMLNNAAGVYSYTVKAGGWAATKRMIVLR